MEKYLIEQARDVCIARLLDSRGIKPARQSGDDLYYISPIRHGDKTPSFHVNTIKNRWFDFGIGEGRDVIGLIMELDGVAFPLAIKLLINFGGAKNYLYEDKKKSASEKRKKIDEPSATKILKTIVIKHPALIEYLSERKIPLELAKRYLQEVHYYLLKKDRNYFTLGFPSGEGFVTRNKKMLSFVGKDKKISFISKKNIENDDSKKQVIVFEGFFDFLSALVLAKKLYFSDDVIILHSIAMKDHAIKKIMKTSYEKVFLCLDNDTEGKKTTTYFQEEIVKQQKQSNQSQSIIIDSSFRYESYNDLNEYLCDNPII